MLLNRHMYMYVLLKIRVNIANQLGACTLIVKTTAIYRRTTTHEAIEKMCFYNNYIKMNYGSSVQLGEINNKGGTLTY